MDQIHPVTSISRSPFSGSVGNNQSAIQTLKKIYLSLSQSFGDTADEKQCCRRGGVQLEVRKR